MLNTKAQTYDKMKDSSVEWLGEIPEGWKTRRFKLLAQVQKGKLPPKITSEGIEDSVPYLSMEYLRGGNANQFVVGKTMAVVEENEMLLLWDGSNSGEFIKSRYGVVSSTIAKISFHGLKKSFAWYACAITERVLRNFTVGMGIPHVDGNILKNSLLPIPPLPEQTAIALFLDKKTAQIDAAVGIKQKQIALLKERKQILIQNAVTQGLNPNAPMCDSGVEWIGKIPKHWEVRRAKYLFCEVDERSVTGREELLSVSHMTGVTPRSEKNVSMFMAEDYSGSKTCQKDDLVFNIMWAWMGALGVADRMGIVSSSYGIFRQEKAGVFDSKYLEWLLKTTGYIEHYNQVSTGLHSSRLRFYAHMFFDMELGYPSKEEQTAIVTHIEKESTKIDQAIALNQQQIEKLKEYKATLINSAVTGKIKVVVQGAGERA